MRSLSFSMNSGNCGMHFGPSIMTEYGLTQEAQISSLLYYFNDKEYVRWPHSHKQCKARPAQNLHAIVWTRDPIEQKPTGQVVLLRPLRP